ncbi:MULTISPECIES: hypothetical protein [Serratia]|uniref:hypothetical protein n=1 Tax=Serratia TaxID=613 RepID=UPI0004E453F1|nr:hypothetical protein DH21_06380 [Serratia marcescens]MBN5333881.1 hypothetical protein [Serratia marcescens]MBN5339463.1 hypothetical protein [Serratia marcescens]PHY66425.1 hypothetical protein CS368_20025 [Serratia marcescens]HAT2882593.1 hypothetical protein [Serratia marcescens]
MNGTIWLDLQMKNYRTETMSKVLFPGQTVALGVGTSFNADLKPSIGHLEIPLGTEFGPLSLPATKLFEFAVDENVGGAGDDIVFGGQATGTSNAVARNIVRGENVHHRPEAL